MKKTWTYNRSLSGIGKLQQLCPNLQIVKWQYVADISNQSPTDFTMIVENLHWIVT